MHCNSDAKSGYNLTLSPIRPWKKRKRSGKWRCRRISQARTERFAADNEWKTGLDRWPWRLLLRSAPIIRVWEWGIGEAKRPGWFEWKTKSVWSSTTPIKSTLQHYAHRQFIIALLSIKTIRFVHQSLHFCALFPPLHSHTNHHRHEMGIILRMFQIIA